MTCLALLILDSCHETEDGLGIVVRHLLRWCSRIFAVVSQLLYNGNTAETDTPRKRQDSMSVSRPPKYESGFWTVVATRRVRL